MERFTLRRADKVCRRQDYSAAFRQGRRIYTRYFSIIVCPNDLGKPRVGIAISRRMKGAARRNRVKRLVREFFRLHKGSFSPLNDYIFSVKSLPPELTYRDVEHDLKNLPMVRI